MVKNELGETLHQDYGLAVEPFSKAASNNVAEYTALVKSLEWLLKNGYSSDKIVVKGDSQLVIYQTLRKWKVKVKDSRIINLYRKVTELKSKFANINFVWVKREENTVADELSNIAYNEALQDSHVFKKVREYWATIGQRRSR